MGSARIALIALRGSASRRTTDYHALIIGTVEAAAAGGGAPTQQWKYICYGLNDLLRLLKDARAGKKGAADPFDNSTRNAYRGFWTDPAQIASADPPASLEGGNLSTDEKALIATNGDDFSGFPADAVRLPFRDVVQVLFYRGGTSPFGAPVEGKEALHAAYARLETCRAIDPDGAATPRLPNDPPPSDFGFKIGSFFEIVAQKPDVSQPGAMLGFRGLFDVRLALNGHDLSLSNDSGLGDAYDTRGRIILARRHSNVHPSLWSYGPDVDPANYENACVFDSVWMGWTAGSAYGHAARRIGELAASGKSLVFMAQQDPPIRVKYPVSETKPGPSSIITSSPLLEQLQFSLESSPGVTREIGFRIGNFDDAPASQYPCLLLRFELYVNQYSNVVLTGLRDIAPAGLSPADGEAKIVGFAQEQRRGDVNAVFDPDSPVRWVITARIDPDAVSGGSVTDPVVKFFDTLVQSAHQGLRAANDGRPLSFLPQIDRSTLSNAGFPWHATGVLEERFAHERSAPYEYGPPPGKGRGMRARLSGFEPRFISDMWRGAAQKYAPPKELSLVRRAYQPPNVDYVATLSGVLQRLVTETGEAPKYSFCLMAPQVQEGHAVKQSSAAAYPAWQPSLSVIDDPFAIPLGTRFALTVKQLVAPVDNTGQRRAAAIGALRVILATDMQGGVTLHPEGFVMLRGLAPEPSGRDELPGGIDAVLRYPIESVLPADQDETDSAVQISARERRNDPLDFRLPDPDAPLLLVPPFGHAGDSATLTVTAEEAVTRHRNHTLGLSLHKIAQQGAGPEPVTIAQADQADAATESGPVVPAPGRLYLIDPQPFRIAAVDYPTFASTDESSEVAVWNAAGEGGLSWRIRDEGQTIHLVLPPQTIGEAMEKNRSSIAGVAKDVDPLRPAAARFGSLTQLYINPSFADARFREPDWNLRRILGQAMQRSPGARLRDLRLELLTG
jgi:hypothetical protein